MDDGLWSLQDAKNRFSAVVDAAVKGTPQTVTKHGKPAVVVISVPQYEKLAGNVQQRRPSFIEHLLSVPKGGRPLGRARIKPRDVKF